MKKKSTELDVEFIGGEGPMTKSEEQEISEFIRTHKLLGAKKQSLKTSATKRVRNCLILR